MIVTYVECDAQGCEQRTPLASQPIQAAILPPAWLYVALPDLEEWYEAPRPRYFCSPQCVIAYQADLIEAEHSDRAIAEVDERLTLADVDPQQVHDDMEAERRENPL